MAGLAAPFTACLALLAPGAAAAERAYRTPVAQGAAAARTAVSAAALGPGLAKLLRGSGGRAGAFVMDAETNQVLFARGSGRRLQLASNTKLFTTATALGRFGPDTRLETSVWAGDSILDGAVTEGLYLRGGGDPTLSSRGLRKLAARVAAAGVRSVQGPLLYDDTFLDRRRGIHQGGIRPDPLGALSALTIDRGRPRDPAKTAARLFADALRKAGVGIGRKVKRGVVPPVADPVPPPPGQPVQPIPVDGPVEVAVLSSPTISDLARLTNVPSDNFIAEMLLKDLGGAFGGAGSTAAGVQVVQRFAAERNSSFAGENGSGLSRLDRASPESVTHLLDSMLEDTLPDQAKLKDAFVQSLAVAGRSGTLAGRMRGSAAQGRCAGKTGTINGVSALSGYCFRSADEVTVFSILNNRVNTDRARSVQDRMTALIARYSP